MSKKFIVEIERKEGDEDTTSTSIQRSLYTEESYMKRYWDITVTELPPLPEDIEDALESLYWVFDNKKAGKNLSERDCFKMSLRQFVANLERKPLPEVKKIETGVLMSPADICECGVVAKIGFKVHADSYCELLLSDENIGKRIVISSRVFPREFYRDIETTWDFSSIPDDSLIVATYHTGTVVAGYYDAENKSVRPCKSKVDQNRRYLNDSIKSIRIVELPNENK